MLLILLSLDIVVSKSVEAHAQHLAVVVRVRVHHADEVPLEVFSKLIDDEIGVNLLAHQFGWIEYHTEEPRAARPLRSGVALGRARYQASLRRTRLKQRIVDV